SVLFQAEKHGGEIENGGQVFAAGEAFGLAEGRRGLGKLFQPVQAIADVEGHGSEVRAAGLGLAVEYHGLGVFAAVVKHVAAVDEIDGALQGRGGRRGPAGGRRLGGRRGGGQGQRRDDGQW